MFNKKVVCISFLSIYFFNICSVFSATRKPASSSSRKVSKTTTRRVKRAQAPSVAKSIIGMENMESSIGNAVQVDTSSQLAVQPVQTTQTMPATQNQSTSTTQTTTTTTTNTTTTTTQNTAVAPEVFVSEEQKINAVPADPDWQEFKFCMQQQCMGSAEQPTNVQCYKSINFDNAFQSCKVMIKDVAKYDLFSKYFTDVYLINEQEEACRNIYSGKYNRDKQSCDISINFSRKYVSNAKVLKNDLVGCNDNINKTWSITAVKTTRITCSHDAFGLGACYSDNPEQTGNEIALYTGIGSTVLGVGVGVTSGVLAGMNATEQVSTGNYTEDGNEILKTEQAGTSKKVFEGISEGWQAGSGLITSGVGQIITSTVSAKNVGPEVFGRCSLPDGRVVQEGSIIELSW